MSKKDIVKTLDIASFVSAVVATLLVLIFQFTGTYMVMKASIIMYAVCFLLLAVLLSLKVHSLFSKKEVSDGETVDEQTSKKQKIISTLLLALDCIAFVLTCVLLALY